MKTLLETLGDVLFFSTLGPSKECRFLKDDFIKSYEHYLQVLMTDVVLDEPFRFHFTTIITKSEDAIATIALPDGRHMVQPLKPILQMRPHRLGYSRVDGEFRPLVFGQKSISWGVQISYPQLYQDPKNRVVSNALDEELFENTSLYYALKDFIRKQTLPTPFVVDGAITRVPMRLGKDCFSWINGHKELTLQGVEVCNI